MLEQVRYWTKLTQSGIFLVRYRTKIQDAGMPMPVLVSSMPMPSYEIITKVWTGAFTEPSLCENQFVASGGGLAVHVATLLFRIEDARFILRSS